MGRATLGLLAALTLTGSVHVAYAAPGLQVSRTEQAWECPDAQELQQKASLLESATAAAATHDYRVTFERTRRGYRAQMLDSTTQPPRVRELDDVGPECAPLGRAVALALATLWATELLATPPTPPSPAPPTAPAPPPAPTPAPTPVWVWRLDAGAGVAVGLVRPVAPLLVADSGFARGPFSASLGAVWVPAQNLPLGPGQLEVQLLAASARACAWTAPARLRAALCARLLAGEALAKSRGFDLDAQQSRPWAAAALDAPLDLSLFRPLRALFCASLLLPLRDQSFSVLNVGVAYQPPPLAALFSLSLEWQNP
jgi:hypothetical protein